MGSTLLVETRDQVRWLTLSRPQRRNALDREIMTALREAIVEAGGDPAVRVLVLAGAGGATKIKRSIDRALDAGLDEVLENERHFQQEIFPTEDFNEGVRAFLEKRAAVYKGR